MFVLENKNLISAQHISMIFTIECYHLRFLIFCILGLFFAFADVHFSDAQAPPADTTCSEQTSCSNHPAERLHKITFFYIQINKTPCQWNTATIKQAIATGTKLLTHMAEHVPTYQFVCKHTVSVWLSGIIEKCGISILLEFGQYLVI
jgi:hypothetical protein